jgi:hypothetical protein
MWKALAKDLSVGDLFDALGVLWTWTVFLVFFVLVPGVLIISFLRWVHTLIPGPWSLF